MAIIRGAEAPKFQVEGFNFTGQTAPSRGATEISSWRVEALAGAVSGQHLLDREEVFLILDGALTFNVGGEIFEVSAGDAVSVSPQTLLQISNQSQKAAHFIACLPVGGKATMADGTEIGTPPWAL
jgi:quercetin dioxygenase-like cupin family protein